MRMTPPRASALQSVPSRSARMHSGRCKPRPTLSIPARSTVQPTRGLFALLIDGVRSDSTLRVQHLGQIGSPAEIDPLDDLHHFRPWLAQPPSPGVEFVPCATTSSISIC